MSKNLQNIFSYLSPLLVYKVSGNSMYPALRGGGIVVGTKMFFSLNQEDIIILHSPSDYRLIIKRIKEIKKSSYFVLGDNEKESTDSRHFGWIDRKFIVAKVIYTELLV